MKQYQTIPLDIIFCFGISILFYLLFLYDDGYLRILFGIPFLFFIPGYLFILCLFPSSRIDKRITKFERIVLSIVFSLAILSLIGIGLNFTPLRLSLFWFSSFLTGFVIFFSIFALLRWYQQPPSERMYIHFPKKYPSSHKPIDSFLNIVLVFVVIITISALLIILITSFMGISDRGESFTEFYIIGESQQANNYPKNITAGENNSITLGITNNEQKKMRYTVEVWLINQTMDVEKLQNNSTITYYEMFFIDKIEIQLPANNFDIEKLNAPQWEYPFHFSLFNHSGRYKLQFLLYCNNTELYNKSINYYKIAENKINQAYRTVHIWIYIKEA